MKVSMKATSFILQESSELSESHPKAVYHPIRQLSTLLEGYDNIPYVLSTEAPPTQSKTAEAPGDDDPDPDDELCY